MSNHCESLPLLPNSKTIEHIATPTDELDGNDSIINRIKRIYFHPIRKGSLQASIFALICVTLGTGMLPLPYFFRTNGIILTLLIFLFCAFSTGWTLKKGIRLAYLKQTYCYITLVEKYYGKNHGLVIFSLICMLINSLGSIIAWNVLINKFIKDILQFFYPNLITNIYVVYFSFIILCLIQIPLAIFKTLPSFYIASTIGIFQLLYVILLLFIEFPNYFKHNFDFAKFFYDRNHYFNININVIKMPLVFFTAFGNHTSILGVIAEIRNKCGIRVKNIGRMTFYTELILYVIIMFTSYLSTFDETKELFIDRPHLSVFMLIGFFLMMILMICNISLYYYMMNPLGERCFNNGEEFNFAMNSGMAFTLLTIMTCAAFIVHKFINIGAFGGASAYVGLIFIMPLLGTMKEKSFVIPPWRRGLYWVAISFFSGIGMLCFVLLLVDKLIPIY